MSEPIKVGDLVMVVRVCCSEYAGKLGTIHTVLKIHSSESQCNKCKTLSTGTHLIAAEHQHKGAHISWWKRIPPLSKLEGEQSQESIKLPGQKWKETA